MDTTLKSLQTDYLDLYLIHWPVRLVPNGTHPLFPTKPDGSRNLDWDWDQAKTWAQMEDVLKKGKVKAIGLSNAGIPIIEHIIKTGKVTPAVLQVELHPYCPQHALLKYCKEKGILLEAYSPLGSTSSPLHEDPDLVAVAKKHNVPTATVLISYQVNRGVVVLPKSVTPARIESNLKTIKLDEEDMNRLDKLAESGKQTRFTTPPWGSDFVSHSSDMRLLAVYLIGLIRDSLTGLALVTRMHRRVPVFWLARLKCSQCLKKKRGPIKRRQIDYDMQMRIVQYSTIQSPFVADQAIHAVNNRQTPHISFGYSTITEKEYRSQPHRVVNLKLQKSI